MRRRNNTKTKSRKRRRSTKSEEEPLLEQDPSPDHTQVEADETGEDVFMLHHLEPPSLPITQHLSLLHGIIGHQQDALNEEETTVTNAPEIGIHVSRIHQDPPKHLMKEYIQDDDGFIYPIAIIQVHLPNTEAPDNCESCTRPMDRLVRDHCHECGKFKGWTCYGCNTHNSDFSGDHYRAMALYNDSHLEICKPISIKPEEHTNYVSHCYTHRPNFASACRRSGKMPQVNKRQLKKDGVKRRSRG
jgi:hypothetical protein